MMRKIFALLVIVICVVGLACCSSDRIKNDFFAAVNSGDIAKVRLIVDKYPTVKDAYLNDGWTALTIAARDGNANVVNLLIAKGVDVNRLEGGGNSPLFWAVYYGHEDVVSLLLSHGARVHNKCYKCRDPVTVAKDKKYENIFRLLNEQNRSR